MGCGEILAIWALRCWGDAAIGRRFERIANQAGIWIGRGDWLADLASGGLDFESFPLFPLGVKHFPAGFRIGILVHNH